MESSSGAWVLITIVFLIIFLILRRRSNSKKIIARNSLISKELINLKKEIMCVSTSSIKNKEIVETFSIIKGKSITVISSSEDEDIADNEAMYEILTNAKLLGANAIIDLKRDNITYEVSGSKWQTSQIVYTGTAVKIK